MRQLILPFRVEEPSDLCLKGAEYHYLIHVLRFRRGSEFSTRDISGQEYLATIKGIEESSCSVSLKVKNAESPRSLQMTLFQCLPKGKKIDTIIRQATEAGVKKIVPVISRYSIFGASREKEERWRRIVKEALQQSGSPVKTEVTTPVKFLEIPAINNDSETGLFFHSAPLENKTLHEYLNSGPNRISIVIGPEGGLSGEETEHLIKAGFVPVFLGQNILRTETAAIYSVAAIQIVISEKKSWDLHTTLK